MSKTDVIYNPLFISILRVRRVIWAVSMLLTISSINTNAQSCLDTLSVSDTLFLQKRLGECSITSDSLLAELGISDCPSIVVFPAGPFSGGRSHEIELLDLSQSVKKSFVLTIDPTPLGDYNGTSSEMSVTEDMITFPLAAGECIATKDMLLDQLQIPEDEAIRSSIHFLINGQRITEFSIGDTIQVDEIACGNQAFYYDVNIRFVPQQSTFRGNLNFDPGVTTCGITIKEVLLQLGYNADSCSIDRFTISDTGPFLFGDTHVDGIYLDDFAIAEDFTIRVSSSLCAPNTTIFFGVLEEGKCFLDEFDILDTLGFFDNGKNCLTDQIVIDPPGPYMDRNTTINSITINGQLICQRSFNIDYQLDSLLDEQITLFCNDDLNISMGTECSVTLDADNILEGGAYCFLNYVVDVADNADPDNILYSGHRVDILEPGRYSVTITNPSSGNSCWSVIDVEDKFIDDISCPPDTIRCYTVDGIEPGNGGTGPVFPELGSSLSYELIGSQEYTILGGGSCEISRASYVDITIDECAGPFKTIFDRHWTFSDDHGNVDTCIQRVYVASAPISLLDRFQVYYGECLADFDILDSNGYPSPEETGYPTIDTFYKADVCGNLKMTYEDTPFPLCGESFKLARHWTIIDWCSDEVATLDQVIRIEDKTPPIILESAEDLLLDSDPFICGQQNIDVPLPVYDDCDPNVTIEILYETYDAAGRGILRSNGNNLRIPEILMTSTRESFDVIYVLTDQCGNTSQDTSTITIQDTEPPVAVCNQFTVISVNGSGEALIKAFTFDDLSVDNCGIDRYDARKLEGECFVNEEYTENIRFCCEEVGDTILVEFRVIDLAGNYNTCMVDVLIQDKFKPIITCPDDIIIDCGVDYRDTSITGIPTYRDNCGDIEINFVDQVDLDNCGQGTIRRQWNIIDRGQFEESCVQIITIEENDPFSEEDIMWPANQDVYGCQETLEPSALGRPILDMSNCVSVDASHEDLPFYDVEDACLKIIREWTVVDWCQLNDNNGSAGIWKSNQIIKLISVEGPVFPPRPEETYCIDESECQGLIEVEGNASDGDNCTPDDELIWSFEIRNSDNSVVLEEGQSRMASAHLAPGNYNVLFTVIDGCDNAAIDTVRIIVEDCRPPLLECPAVQPSLVLSTIGVATLDMDEILISATDNCSDEVSLSFNKEVSQTTLVYTCTDIPDGVSAVHFIQVYGSDQSGNIDSCEIMVQLFDNSNNVCEDTVAQTIDTSMIAGLIMSPTLTELENVEVTLFNPTLGELKTITNEFGEYTFEDLTPGETYSISLDKKDDPRDGMQTSDIVLIQRHLLGLRRFDNPYSMIAADVSNDGNISGIDLVTMRRMILGRTTEFPNEQKQWRFVDASQSWSSNELPFPFREIIDITPAESGIIDADFMGVKIGDVNNSNSSTKSNTSKNRNSSILIEVIENKGVYDFVATETTGLFGFQMGIKADHLSSIIPGIINLTEDHYYKDGGEILISYDHSSSPLPVEKGDVLFSIAHAVSVSSISSFQTEWISNDYSVREIELREANSDGGNSLSIESNYPNPFSDITTLSFTLEKANDVRLQVIDLSGRTISEDIMSLEGGTHEYQVSSDQIRLQEGVYIVKLSTAEATAIRRITYVK